MVRKKSSYAEKHADYTSKGDLATSLFFSQNKDLFEVVKNPHNFEKNFLDLPYPRQIALLDLFHDINKGNIVVSPRQIKQTLLDLTYDELEKIHLMTGTYYEEGNTYFPMADDEKKLVRMECYGTIDARREHELSSFYKFFRQKENRGKFRLKDYDLLSSPMWRVFNQFESFQSIAPSVRRYMYKQGFNPDALKVMSVNDFCDVIHKIYATDSGSIKARFLKTGYKNKFVMEFMKHCGKELEQHLLNRKIDERKVKSLCRMMRQYGLCDIDRLTVTETRFTERVWKDLQKNDYDLSAYKIGDLIPEKLVNEIFDNNQESLLSARDENGRLLDRDDLPHFEVHHKNAVKFAHSGDYLAKVNYNNNLMLVEKEIHRAYFHAADNFVHVDSNNERFFSRLNISCPEMCLMNGFDTMTDIFFYDLENNVSAKKRAMVDSQNVVNYYEMQLERLNNIPEIASKYNILYSKTDLSNEYRNLQKLTQFKVPLQLNNLKMFDDLSNPKKGKSTKHKYLKKETKQSVSPRKSGNER